MKAYGECPKCGEYLETNCGGCIDGSMATHCCGDEENEGGEIVEGVKWTLVPENEKELLGVEE